MDNMWLGTRRFWVDKKYLFQLGVIVHVHSPSTGATEAEGLGIQGLLNYGRVGGQPKLPETVSKNNQIIPTSSKHFVTQAIKR